MIYEYGCDACGETFTVISRIDDRNIPLSNPCPNCGCDEESIYRVYSNAGSVDSEMLKADRRMEESGVQQALERIRDHVNPNMKWNG